MGIEYHGDEDTTTKTSDKPQSAAFASASFGGGGAPSGSLDFQSFASMMSIQTADPTVEPYLERVETILKLRLGDSIKRQRLTKTPNSYVFSYTGVDGVPSLFGLLFASHSDPKTPKFIPASVRIEYMKRELEQEYAKANKSSRLVDARVVMAGVPADMERADRMAAAIMRAFSVTTNPTVRNATISTLAGTEFVVSWSLSEAKAVESDLSAHGTRPRMDWGMTLNARIKSEMSQDFHGMPDTYTPLGVIGGYTEFRERELVTENGVRKYLYTPVIHITALNSLFPLEGVGALLCAAALPTLYDTYQYTSQWRDLNDRQPNPGMLEVDQVNKDRPLIIKTTEELREFAAEYFNRPVASFMYQDGFDNIPGWWRMGSDNPTENRLFLSRLGQFFGIDVEGGLPFPMTALLEQRFEGVYGDASGAQYDSRNWDYLSYAAKIGFGAVTQDIRRIMLGGAYDETERAQLIQNITDNFTPLAMTTDVLINPEFIRWIGGVAAGRGVNITDPNSRSESRPIGAYTANFGSSANLPQIVSHGIASRGSGLRSVWSR